MARSLISVVIPVYNGERFLREAIDSVLRQTYQPVEILAVDDGSTDGSRAVISSYGHPVKLVAQANQGVASARNAGVSAASGEFIAFLDQDDWWKPDKLTKQIEVFGQDDNVGLVHSEVRHYDQVTGLDRPRFNPNRTDLLVGNCYERLLLGNAIFNSSVVVRKTVLDQAGPFDTQIAGNTIQDYDLWLRIARISSLAYLPEELAVYRLHPEQGMWNSRPSLVEELKLMERLVGEAAWLANPPMRARMAGLLDEVGVAHLDSKDKRLARQCFGRRLRCGWSWRAGLLLSLTLLPAWLSDFLRAARMRLKPACSQHALDTVPSWAAPSGTLR